MYLFWHSNFPSIKHSSWQKRDGIFGTTNGSGAGGGRVKLAAMSELGYALKCFVSSNAPYLVWAKSPQCS